MLYEFALTAGVFDRFPPAVQGAAEQSLVQALYGIRRSGILANLYNGSWWAEVNRKQGVSQRVRPVVNDLLKQLFDRGMIIERHREGATCPRRDTEWLDESLASHKRQAFDGIVTRHDSIHDRVGLPACVVSLEDLLLSPVWNGRVQTRRVSRNRTDFERALAPVLSTARLVTLIDPHIAHRVYKGNLEFIETLRIMDRCLCPLDRRCAFGLLEIHTEDHCEIPDGCYPEITRRISEAMPTVSAGRGQKWFRVWQQRPGGKPFHNRRILTNQTGLSCPWGLDIHEGPGITPGDDEWAILDDSVREAISRDFQQNTTPYRNVFERSW